MAHQNFEPHEPGVWAEPYHMPDGSRPITAIDEDGVLRGVYYMRPDEDAVAIHRYMTLLLGRSHRRGLQIVN